MSDASTPPPAQPVPSEPSENGTPAASPRERTALGRLVPRSNGARWAALGAAVVVVGGAVTAVAVAEHHHDRPDRPRLAWSVPGADGPVERRAEGAGPGPGPGRPAGPKEHRVFGAPEAPGGRGGDSRTAPAPLPSLAIGEAAAKAAAAVTGGKVESLRVVAQEGGGSAWLAVVLGPDGVRHAVTVSGTDGTVSGNTPLTR
ncbi:hypothetical protein ABZZ17_13140 [Streptomyces sp. NPDC006512]|uniref:hypothetical protein n=1 Tax=Streptomyces sp. NPDC006512 TaxID=3154307 RepID=UPI0033A18C23